MRGNVRSMDPARSCAVGGATGGGSRGGPPGPRGGETLYGYKRKRRRPVSSSGWSPSLPPYRLFPSAESSPGFFSARPQPQLSSSRQLDGLARETDRVHRDDPGGSRRAPVPHGDLPVRPGGRGSPQRAQRPHGARRAGRQRGGREVQVHAHVHRQPVAGGPSAAHAVPAQQRRRLSSSL